MGCLALLQVICRILIIFRLGQKPPARFHVAVLADSNNKNNILFTSSKIRLLEFPRRIITWTSLSYSFRDLWNNYMQIWIQKCTPWIISIGGSRGARPVHAPPTVQILLFWHAKFILTKHSRLGGPRPPYEVHAPPTGNPGSATDINWFRAFSPIRVAQMKFLSRIQCTSLILAKLFKMCLLPWLVWCIQYVLRPL